MKKEECSHGCCGQKVVVKHHHHGSHSDALYGLGVIGALFYFLKGAVTLTAVLVGIVKSVFWPALVVFWLLTQLHL